MTLPAVPYDVFDALAGFAAAIAISYASLLQVFDVLSTNLVISKGRGHEANGPIAWLQKKLGGWWWVYKIPLIAVFVAIAIKTSGWPSVGVLTLVCLIYSYAVWNNYMVAWRQR